MKLGFIGAGNMASAIFKGLIAAKAVQPEDIYIIRNNKKLQEEQAKELGINGCQTYEELFNKSDIIFLGVKPASFPALLSETKELFAQKKHLIVSMAAGLSTKDIQNMLGFETAIVRIMPNINASIRMSATACCGSAEAVKIQAVEKIEKLMSAVGSAYAVAEDKFAIFTAIAGCSPAYVYMFIDALARGAQKMGMNKQQALDISAQAVLGSAAMFMQSGKHPAELTDSVCSPGGTTIEGVCTLEEYKFSAGIVKAVENSILKDALLSKK